MHRTDTSGSAPESRKASPVMSAPNPSVPPMPGTQPVKKTKWIVQLIVSILCFFNIITIVLAIMGLVKADSDLPLANKLYKWGWIIYAIWAVIVIVVNIIVAANGGYSFYVDTY